MSPGELAVLVVRVVVLGAADRLLVDRMGDGDRRTTTVLACCHDDYALQGTFRHSDLLLLLRARLRSDGLDAGDIA
jgi:hypothetical protein